MKEIVTHNGKLRVKEILAILAVVLPFLSGLGWHFKAEYAHGLEQERAGLKIMVTNIADSKCR